METPTERVNPLDERWSAKSIGRRRILVTGASGFVGGRVSTVLERAGHEVVRVGRRKLDRANYLSCDLSQPWPTHLIQKCDSVIHAAARSSPWGRRTEFEKDNVVATQNLLRFCNETGHPRIVHISSSSVFYRNEDQIGITESTPIPERFVNIYAETKRKSELVVESYSGPWSILRPRAVFGPGDTVLLPRILRAAKQGRLPYLYRPGTPVVGDLIYIDNLVDQISQAAFRDDVSGAINVTNAEPVVVMDLIVQILERLNLKLPSRRVTVKRAMLFAGLLEFVYRTARLQNEPPITRFGVHVFAYSKTFDVSRMLEVFGSPRIGLKRAIDTTVESLFNDGTVERSHA